MKESVGLYEVDPMIGYHNILCMHNGHVEVAFSGKTCEECFDFCNKVRLRLLPIEAYIHEPNKYRIGVME